MDTLAETAPPPETSVNWNFVPLAVFGVAMVVLVYAANLIFWWVGLPQLEQINLGAHPPTPVPFFLTWAHFLHHYALLVLPVFVGLAAFHGYALFSRTSPRRRLFAWLGMMLVGFALIAQYGFTLLSLVLNMGK